MKYHFGSRQFIETDLDPEKLAIAGSEKDIDWKTLKFKTDQVVNTFKRLAIPSGHPVIIYGHKEHFFPVAILACIHSGITFVPVDKIYPVERIKKIIEKTGSRVLINCSDVAPDIEIAVTINSGSEAVVHRVPEYKDQVYGEPGDPLQYIMFTSGSTGEPKGVQITYNSILTFLDWAIKDFGFNSGDVFMNQAPFTFDVSLFDLLNSFAHGGTLVLTSNESAKDPEAFFKRLIHYKCSVWTSTPSFVYLFLRHPDFNSEKIPGINTFLFIGENLPNRTCAHLKKAFNNARILNSYGPTEATIVTTLVEITGEIIDRYPLLPIGYPMTPSKLIIEKKNPGDKEGELIIAGDHVSAGYFKNEEFNKQKFFFHEGKKAFKTGDLAYYENGMFFCTGRNDDQVKMNGFRIELNEISAVICTNELISNAVTVALKRNNEVKKIISFVILKNPLEKEALIGQLIPFLKKKIPYYMMPGDIVPVNDFPYSASHKIDKNKMIDDYLNRKFDVV